MMKNNAIIFPCKPFPTLRQRLFTSWLPSVPHVGSRRQEYRAADQVPGRCAHKAGKAACRTGSMTTKRSSPPHLKLAFFIHVLLRLDREVIPRMREFAMRSGIASLAGAALLVTAAVNGPASADEPAIVV